MMGMRPRAAQRRTLDGVRGLVGFRSQSDRHGGDAAPAPEAGRLPSPRVSAARPRARAKALALGVLVPDVRRPAGGLSGDMSVFILTR